MGAGDGRGGGHQVQMEDIGSSSMTAYTMSAEREKRKATQTPTAAKLGRGCEMVHLPAGCGFLA